MFKLNKNLGEILEEEVERSIHQYLVGEEAIAGVINENGEKLTLQDAYKKRLLKRSL